MHITYLPSWYPTKKYPFDAQYLQEQIRLFSRSGIQTQVIHYDTTLKSLSDLRLLSRRTGTNEKNGTIRSSTIYGVSWPKMTSATRRLWVKSFFKHFDQICTKENLPRLIHAHGFLAGYLASQIKCRYKIPYVLTEHSSILLASTGKRSHELQIREAYDGTDILVAVSKHLKQEMQNYTQTPIQIVPNFIDTQKFKSPESHSTKFKIACVTSLIPGKNVQDLIDALIIFNRDQPQVDFLCEIYGEGPLRKDLQKQITAANLGSRCVLMGGIKNEFLPNALSTAHCLIQPSHQETFSIVLIEALAAGVPIICGPLPLAVDLKKWNVGNVATRFGGEALAKGLKKILRTEYDKDKLRQVASGYDYRVVIPDYIEIYQNLLTGS